MKTIYGVADKGDCIFFCCFDIDQYKSTPFTDYKICQDCGQRGIDVKHESREELDTGWLSSRQRRRFR